MPRPRKTRPNWEELATIWQVSDDLWAVIAPILAELDPKSQGTAAGECPSDPRRGHLPAA